MKIPGLALLFLTLVGVASVRAALGEDRAALARQYGEPTHLENQPALDVWIYHTPDYEITVDFEKERSVNESFKRTGEDKAFSEGAIQTILHTQSAGRTWLENLHPEKGRRWVRKGATAIYVRQDNGEWFLIISTEDGLPHLKGDPDVSGGKAKGRR